MSRLLYRSDLRLTQAQHHYTPHSRTQGYMFRSLLNALRRTQAHHHHTTPFTRARMVRTDATRPHSHTRVHFHHVTHSTCCAIAIVHHSLSRSLCALIHHAKNALTWHKHHTWIVRRGCKGARSAASRNAAKYCIALHFMSCAPRPKIRPLSSMTAPAPHPSMSELSRIDLSDGSRGPATL